MLYHRLMLLKFRSAYVDSSTFSTCAVVKDNHQFFGDSNWGTSWCLQGLKIPQTGSVSTWGTPSSRYWQLFFCPQIGKLKVETGPPIWHSQVLSNVRYILSYCTNLLWYTSTGKSSTNKYRVDELCFCTQVTVRSFQLLMYQYRRQPYCRVQ